MAILDGIIIILITFGVLYGTKRGFLNGIVSLAGLFIAFIFGILFRGMIADVLLKGMPFLKFSGSYKGMSSLNILFYEAIAFVLIFLFFISLLSIILKLTGVLQKVIDYSIVLTLPSKILGVIVGVLNALIISYAMSFVMLNMNSTRWLVHESKIANFLLKNTIIVPNVSKKYYESTKDVNDIIDKCKHQKNKKKCNKDVANTLIKNKVVSKDKVIELIESGKLKNINKGDIK